MLSAVCTYLVRESKVLSNVSHVLKVPPSLHWKRKITYQLLKPMSPILLLMWKQLKLHRLLLFFLFQEETIVSSFLLVLFGEWDLELWPNKPAIPSSPKLTLSIHCVSKNWPPREIQSLQGTFAFLKYTFHTGSTNWEQMGTHTAKPTSPKLSYSSLV